MERELWPKLYPLLREVGKDFRQKYVSYQPWILVAVLLWAAIHDRTLAWACKPSHWSTTRLRPWRLPSPSVLSRRLYGVAVGALLRALEQRIRDSQDLGLLAFLDGKPLTVSSVSKDREAKRGRGAGGMAKGYKLHTVWANRAMPEAWEVTPLNVSELVAAERLVQQLEGAGYVLADGNYDSSPLFDRLAQRCYQLLVPIKHANAGKGHRYQSPHRLGCIERMRTEYGQEVHGERRRIEQAFGNATSFAGGLGPLPAWVRGMPRVRTWVWAKLLINGVRILEKQRLAA